MAGVGILAPCTRSGHTAQAPDRPRQRGRGAGNPYPAGDGGKVHSLPAGGIHGRGPLKIISSDGILLEEPFGDPYGSDVK